MTREEFIKQRCEIDKITEEEFEKTYRVVKCNCGETYCKGYRCLDSDDLLKENQKLKKQLENCYCNRTDCMGRIKDSKVYDSLEQKIETQQKEFIKYLEDGIERKRLNATCTTEYNDYVIPLRVILQKYKSIIGVSDENKTTI